MQMLTTLVTAAAPRQPSRYEAPLGLAAMGALTVALAAAIALATGWGARYIVAAVALYGLIAGAVTFALSRERPRPPFRPASQITLLRAVPISLVGGLVALEAVRLTPDWGWTMTALSLAAFSLDAADGWVARRLGQATAFGARFDQELDAFFIALLAVVAWRLDQVGAWVLLIGAMYYAFMLAGYLRPALTRPLPPRRRRKVVCALQVAALLAALAPAIGPMAASWLAAGALVALSYSFGVDVLWLLGTREPGADAAG